MLTDRQADHRLTDGGREGGREGGRKEGRKKERKKKGDCIYIQSSAWHVQHT